MTAATTVSPFGSRLFDTAATAAAPTTTTMGMPQVQQMDDNNNQCQEQQQQVAACGGGSCGGAEAGAAAGSAAVYPRFKTSMCFFHKKGRCLNGENCRFAHGLSELKRHQSNFLKTIVSKTSTIASLTSIPPPPPFIPRPPSSPPPSELSSSRLPRQLSPPMPSAAQQQQQGDDNVHVVGAGGLHSEVTSAASLWILPGVIPTRHNNSQQPLPPTFVETNNIGSVVAAGGGLSGITTTALPQAHGSCQPAAAAACLNYTTNAVIVANGAAAAVGSSPPLFVVDSGGISSNPSQVFYCPPSTTETTETGGSCCGSVGVGMGSSSMYSSAAGYPQQQQNLLGEAFDINSSHINFVESLDFCGDVLLSSKEAMTARTELVVASESSRVVLSPIGGLCYNDNDTSGMCGQQQLLTPSVQIMHAAGGVTATAASGMAYGIGTDAEYIMPSSSMSGVSGGGGVTEEYGKTQDYEHHQYCYDGANMALSAETGVMILQPSAQVVVKDGVGNLPVGWVNRTLAKWSGEEEEFKAGDEWYCVTKREEKAEAEGQTHSMRRACYSCASSDSGCSDDCCVGEYTCPTSVTENLTCGDNAAWRPDVAAAQQSQRSSAVDPSVVRRTLLSLISDKVEETAPYRCGYYPEIPQIHRAAAEERATDFNYHAALVCLNQASSTEDFTRLVCSSNVCPWSDNFD
eukprot:GHVS01004422.1.p1 GENE.GHVS01004422.1~~GHVS01004422.1.p1  ORF type:complete len:687 (+),score=189.94 GHVS01004422.1:643-2703(+)